MKIIQKTLELFKSNTLAKYKLVYLSSLVWFLGTASVFAQGAGTTVGSKAVTLINPLKIKTAEELLTTILGIVIILATPVIVFFIIYAGFLYVTARGNAEQVTQANRALTYAIIGGVIIIGSVAIATIIKNIVLAF